MNKINKVEQTQREDTTLNEVVKTLTEIDIAESISRISCGMGMKSDRSPAPDVREEKLDWENMETILKLKAVLQGRLDYESNIKRHLTKPGEALV
ncbi:hypothetical protein llap_11497 [Limosa lapponica baueri]|uniref:Uncharacterized protein n=1 Tax=Limosa lapponica baueri TaxID=1758121 RepID=A0A2I0TWK2_LIMLA|nr:hypothetical protein llap_11497 [Limosa lapponica baueri]